MARSIIELRLRSPEELSEQDEGLELEDFVDYAVERELSRHPEHSSRRKKLISVQDTFGLNAVEVANWFGITETESRRYLSRRGIRDDEFEQIEERFNHIYAISSMIRKHKDGLNSRRQILFRQNALLRDLGLIDWIIAGETRRAVAVVENTFRRIQEQG